MKLLVSTLISSMLLASNVTFNPSNPTFSFSTDSDSNYKAPVKTSKNNDLERASNFKCFNAFSIENPLDSKYYPSILTQVQNETFYLKVVRKCPIKDVSISIIDSNGSDVNSSIKKFPGGILQVKIPKIHKDLFVHFDYNVTILQANKDGYIIKKREQEENSTDDFAVRPEQFNIYVENNDTFVGKFLKVDLNVTGYKGNLCDYNKSRDLDVSAENSFIIYDYYIRNGKAVRYSFIITKAGNTKIHIKEKIGSEYAIVDADDTADRRRLIGEGVSNEINVKETSKSWAGVGSNKGPYAPSKRTIQADIKNNVNRRAGYTKIQW